jgi:hypothetical protein
VRRWAVALIAAAVTIGVSIGVGFATQSEKATLIVSCIGSAATVATLMATIVLSNPGPRGSVSAKVRVGRNRNGKISGIEGAVPTGTIVDSDVSVGQNEGGNVAGVRAK